MKSLLLGELVMSHKRQTLSARVIMMDNLDYSRYSIFFNQPVTDIGPSHILISKRLVSNELKWVCEERSALQDDELAELAGKEIDRYLLAIRY
jgi:hypothetical protein